MDGQNITIAHVITRFINGGADANTLEACNWLAQHDHKVHLLFGQEYDDSILARLDSRVQVTIIPDLVNPIHPLRDIKAFIQLRREFSRIRPDIVHTHTSKAGIIGRAAARIASKPLIVHGIHIAPFDNVRTSKRLLYLALERLAASWTDAFVSVSEGMRNVYLDAGVGPTDKHYVIHSGMSIQEYKVAPPANWRTLLNLADAVDRPPVVLMVAGLEKRKRHRELIDALAPVFDRVPDMLLVLAGGGKEYDAIADHIDSKPFRDRVRLLGHVERPGALIALADVAVHCAEREGLPRVIVQYIAGGLPVIMTRLPGVGELVVDEKNGFLVDQDDFAGLANAVADTLLDDTKLRKLRQGAARVDVSNWDLSVTGRKQQAIYDGLLRTTRVLVSDQHAKAAL